jgi:hypothetical protein
MHHTVHLDKELVAYSLPLSKTYKFSQGSQVLVHRSKFNNDCLVISQTIFKVETHTSLTTLNYGCIAMGRSLYSLGLMGGFKQFLSIVVLVVTQCALAGVSPQLIQAVGRWSSDEFKKYIQIHPYILQALIHDSSS